MKEQALRQLLVLYLRFNDQPSDQQFHALAESLGVDKEFLESIAYEMLAETDEVAASSTHSPVGVEENCMPETLIIEADADAPGDAPQSEAQEVLDGEYDPFTTSPDDLLLNDGAPEGTSNIEENQDATYDDGVAVEDVGIDVSSDKNAMYDDGVAPIQLAALARLGLVTAASGSPLKDLVDSLDATLRPLFKVGAAGPVETYEGKTYRWAIAVGKDDELVLNIARKGTQYTAWLTNSRDTITLEAKAPTGPAMKDLVETKFVPRIKKYLKA